MDFPVRPALHLLLPSGFVVRHWRAASRSRIDALEGLPLEVIFTGAAGRVSACGLRRGDLSPSSWGAVRYSKGFHKPPSGLRPRVQQPFMRKILA